MLSMQHWNGNQMVCMDVETTGLDPGKHEIWQLAAIAVDSNLNIRKDVLPFDILMQPQNLELVNWDVDVMKKNKPKILQAAKEGFDPLKAIDLFEAWIAKLNIPLNTWGVNRCKIIPLGHNYAFDMAFIKRWLGIDFYEENFHYHYRDSMHAAAYLNDRAAMRAEKVPYARISLGYLASVLKIESRDAHDALSDAQTTIGVYKSLISLGLMI